MESFWCKVLFKQFISHFRKLSDDAIIADIKDSMDALEELQETGDSFGAMMVRLSNKRILENSEKRAEAGRKGGYAKAKNCKKKKAEATPSETVLTRPTPVTASRCPRNVVGKTKMASRSSTGKSSSSAFVNQDKIKGVPND